MVGVWTIEIGGTARKWKDIDFERRLRRDRPIRFSATVEYSSDIDYFDLVEIKRDGVVEFKGFIKTINLEWDEIGRFLDIGGRDSTVILWKKWAENFSNMHEDTKGFFGLVSAEELIKFLLRNPTSDLPSEYPSNKSGWGMDRTRISECSARRTSVGDPNWVKLRRRGYGWRNKGTQFNSQAPDVDANISHEWDDSGAGDNPWIENLDDTTYIVSNTTDQEDVFSFEDLSTLDATASSINRCDIAVRWKPRRSLWGSEYSRCEIWLSPDNGTNYYYIGAFGGHSMPFNPNPFRTHTYNASHIIDTVAKADVARVKFINKANHNIFISWCYLAINYSTDGDQETDDYFDIPFDYDEIMGIYVESRFDEDSYPRDYRIFKVHTELQDYTTFSELANPNAKLTVGANHLDWLARKDEETWLGDDKGAGFFANYFRHTFDLKVVTDPVPLGLTACVWAVTNDVDSLLDLTGNFICLLVANSAGTPYFVVKEVKSQVEKDSDDSIELTEGVTYSIEIVRHETIVQVNIYSAGVLFDTLEITLDGTGDDTYQYLFNVITSNTGVNGALETDFDIDNLTLEVETALIDEVNGNTFRDIIHSWEPQEMSQIRIRITAQSSGDAWTISQIYVYPSVDFMLRTYRDNVTTTLLTGDATSGQKVVAVTDADSYNDLDIVTIKDGNNQEVNQVASKAGLNITMVYDLEYTYETAEGAELIKGFPTEQYIGAFSFDTSYTTPIGPLNIPRSRLIDAINIIMEKCEASYVPYEWWLALDANNTFHMDSQRGNDISGTVSFIKGINLGGTKKITGIVDTIQRLKLLGQGEGQRQEEIGSDWAQSKTEMVNVNTFFEEVISDKSVIDPDIADVIANVHITEEAPPNTQITCKVNNDEYVSMVYDVGDTVTVTDSLSVVSGTHKIYNIMKKITKDGEKVTVVVNAPYKDKEDEWHEIYKRIKMIEISEATAADWTGEVVNEKKVSAEDAVTDLFEKTAKNDTIDEAKGVRDPKWNFAPAMPDAYNPMADHTAGGGPVSEYYDWNVTLQDMKFYHTDKKMMMTGPTGGAGAVTLMIEMAGETGDRIDIPLTKNPKLVAELKFAKDTDVPEDWKEGDIFEIGLYDLATSIGYYIRFTKDAGNTFTAEAVWDETGSDERTQTLMTVKLSNLAASENYRYRIEIIVDSDEDMVFFNIYDLTFDPPQKYPTSVVKLDINVENIVKPLYMAMMADNDGAGAPNLARVYIYHFKTEWEKVQ